MIIIIIIIISPSLCLDVNPVLSLGLKYIWDYLDPLNHIIPGAQGGWFVLDTEVIWGFPWGYPSWMIFF